MATRREKAKPQKPQLRSAQGDASLANNIITSLFNDVTDKTTIYLVGLGVVCTTLLLGLRLTNKRKDIIWECI